MTTHEHAKPNLPAIRELMDRATPEQIRQLVAAIKATALYQRLN